MQTKFDSVPAVRTAVTFDKTIEDLSSLMDRPSLMGLSYALRHPETWPAKFTWNYDDCDTCAMGLAYQLWRSQMENPPRNVDGYISWAARSFSMPFKVAKKAFQHASVFTHFGYYDHVTPEKVADVIDAYLAKAV